MANPINNNMEFTELENSDDDFDDSDMAEEIVLDDDAGNEFVEDMEDDYRYEQDMEEGQSEQDQEKRVKYIPDRDDAILVYHSHTDAVYAVHGTKPTSNNPGLMISGSGDDSAHLWKASTGECLHQIQHKDTILACEFSPNGELFATAGMDGVVNVCITKTGKLFAQFDGPDEFSCMRWSPRGDAIAAGAADGTVWVYDVKRKLCLHVFTFPSGGSVTHLEYLLENSLLYVVAVSDDGNLMAWEVESGEKRSHLYSTSEDTGVTSDFLKYHTLNSTIHSLSIHSHLPLALTGADDCQAMLVHVPADKVVSRLSRHSSAISASSFTTDMAATGDTDGLLVVWDIHRGLVRSQAQPIVKQNASAVTQLLWQSHILYSAHENGVIFLHDGRTGERYGDKFFQGHSGSIWDLLFLDQYQFATASDDHTVRIFDVRK